MLAHSHYCVKFVALATVGLEIQYYAYARVHIYVCIYVLMGDEKEGRKKQTRSNKQQS